MKLLLPVILCLVLPFTLHSQCPSGTVASSQNLVFNGDFSLGNTGFTSQYAYCNTTNCLWPTATYAVGTNAALFHNNFVGFDHTTGNGNFMIVNGSGTPNTEVWCQTIVVTPNTTYQFSTWVQSCVTSSPAILQFNINGQAIGPNFVAPSSLFTWEEFYATWNSGSNTTADICIVNQNIAQSGNDFGLDDIAFSPCIPCQIQQLTASNDTTVCESEPVPLNATANSTVTFQWSPPGGLSNAGIANPIATPATTTSYIVTATDPLGCLLKDTVNITIDQGPDFDLPAMDTICAGDDLLMPLTTTGTYQYQWSPTTGLSCTTCAQPIVNITQTTTYSVTVTNTNGCTLTDSIRINVAARPIVDAGPDRIICNLPFTQLAGTYSDSTAMGTVVWSPPTGLSHTFILNPVARPTNTTTYTLTIANAYGCTSSDTVRVIRSVAVADAGPDTTICPGQSTMIGSPAEPNTTYLWAPAGSLNNPALAQPTATPGSTTMYTLTVTDSNGCQATDFVRVTIGTRPTVTAGADVTICPGSSTTLQASGASTYQWQPGSQSGSSLTVNPSTTTVYTVTGTNAAGCSNTDEVTVTVSPNPSLTVSPDPTICAGDTTSLLASGAVSFTWSPGNNLSCTACPNPQAYPVANTTFTVIGTDANGCKDTQTVQVFTQNGPPINTSADVTICPGDTASLSVSGGASYLWAPAGSLSCSACPNPKAFPAQPTTYTVTAFNPIGCNSVDTIRVDVSGVNNVIITGDTTLCAGQSRIWQVQGATTIQWSPATGLSCTACPNPTVSPASTTTYTLTGTDQNGCTFVPVTRNMTIAADPIISLTHPDTVCVGTVVSLQAGGGTQYTWSPSAGLSCANCPNPSSIITKPTTYSVTVTNAAGCTSDTSLSIFAQPAPVVTIDGTNQLCTGDSIQLWTANGNAQWTGGSWMSCMGCDTVTIWPTTSSFVYATVTDNVGCTGSDSLWVNVLPLPTITAIPDTLICGGQPVLLQATGGSSYLWSPASSLSCTACPTPIATPFANTTYSVVGTDAFGCSNSATVSVQIAVIQGLTITADTTICLGDSLWLEAGGAVSYSWAPPTGLNTTTGNRVRTNAIDTIQYTLRATDANGCLQDTSVWVYVHAPLSPFAEPDTAVCPGEWVTLTAMNGAIYQWEPAGLVDNPAAASPMVRPAQTTIYTVTIIDSVGCINSETVRVAIYPPAVADAGPDKSIGEGTFTYLQGSGGIIYLWQPGNSLDDATSPQPVATPADSTWYTLQVWDENGCTDIDSVLIAVIKQPKLIVPNGFSPNGDGQNDLFGIGFQKGLILEEMMVFDRWGDLVFQTNDVTTGWNGIHNGTPASIGNYVYLIRGKTLEGDPFLHKGNVTLLR